MIPASELDPLSSGPLRRRLPQLQVAMDEPAMAEHLRVALFDPATLVELSTRPKARLVDDGCRLHYPVRVRSGSQGWQEGLVFGSLHADAAHASALERERLAPLAARREVPTLAVRATAVDEPLGLALSVFPVSDELTTLAEVADPHRLTDVLPTLLGRELAAPVDGVEVVRITRTPRCVLRLRLGDGSTLFAKVVPVLPSTSGVDERHEALDRCQATDARVVFPRLLGWSDPLQLMLFAPLPGSRPPLRAQADLATAMDAAMRAAASIHRAGITVGATRTFESELADARRTVDRIRDDAPVLAGWLSEVVDAVERVGTAAPVDPITFCHGDFTPSQLLVTGPSVAVLDFDDACQAETSLDIGRFLAYVRVALARSGLTDDELLGRRFLAGYRAAGGPPTSEERTLLYAQLSLVVMAVHSWQRLKPRRLEVVCSVLERSLPQD